MKCRSLAKVRIAYIQLSSIEVEKVKVIFLGNGPVGN